MAVVLGWVGDDVVCGMGVGWITDDPPKFGEVRQRTELPDDARGVCPAFALLLELLHKGFRAGAGDGAEVRDQFTAAHAQPRVLEGDGARRLVGRQVDFEGQGRVGDGGFTRHLDVPELLEGVLFVCLFVFLERGVCINITSLQTGCHLHGGIDRPAYGPRRWR